MSFNFAVLAFMIVVTIHNFEEAVLLPEWSKTAGRWHRPVGSFQFRFAVTILTFLSYAAAFLSFIGGKDSIGVYLVSGYALAMLLNVVFPHLLATAAMRRYAPGTATAVLLNLPITLILLHQGFEEEYINRELFLYTAPFVVIGILLLIPGLFWLGSKCRAFSRL